MSYVRSPGTLVAGAEARPPGLGGLRHGLVGLGDHGRPGEVVRGGPGLTSSIGEGPNHSNFSDESSVNIVSEFRKVF